MSQARRIRRKGERYVVKRTVSQIKKEVASGGNTEEVFVKYYKEALEQLKKTFNNDDNLKEQA